MRFGFWGIGSGADVEEAALLLPGERQFHADEPINGDMPWLSTAEDRLGDVRRQKGKRQKLANISFRLSCGNGEGFSTPRGVRESAGALSAKFVCCTEIDAASKWHNRCYGDGGRDTGLAAHISSR